MKGRFFRTREILRSNSHVSNILRHLKFSPYHVKATIGKMCSEICDFYQTKFFFWIRKQIKKKHKYEMKMKREFHLKYETLCFADIPIHSSYIFDCFYLNVFRNICIREMSEVLFNNHFTEISIDSLHIAHCRNIEIMMHPFIYKVIRYFELT